ncbi:PDR/VanB family oxidoreductase [Gryllotalpicola protaetiae]|uniref:Oxidoreductase n=1 Tax=Gryllotalpicola protaetiae TaxID=2419771 RepID=A0A387BMD8_9MICO|nr:PDR/VanB family oxidoreductase [Gryllotalpicola protaetiae]AYG04983.1 oxidoreductase [Gryllotalpicola protaetiae]
MSAVEPEIDVVVAERAQLADGVVQLELASTDGADLPSWQPGAHIDLLLAPGLERQYSLIGAQDDGRWRVAVYREHPGRGGSALVHDSLAIGDLLRARAPRNHFAFSADRAAIFIAGGIGITPIVSMIAAAEAAGTEWVLHYAGRSRAGMAFGEELAARHPSKVFLHIGSEGTRMDVPALLAEPSGASVFCCGSTRLMEAVEAAVDSAGWPSGALHLERFTPKAHAAVTDEEFEVELEFSGMTLTVPPGRSILDTADEAGVLVLSSCREGTCGTCETHVVSGEVDHRDSVLSPEEQAENRTMMICVSRAAPGCPRLVLEL